MNEDFKNELKDKWKRNGKRLLKVVIIAACIIAVLFAASIYQITLNDGTFKEGDWANTQYAASQFTRGTSIDSDGNITTNMTAQELWDKMMEEDSRVDLYLDGPEELLKLMNAEIVTQYLDTRGEDEIDKPIIWDDTLDINSNEVQGIIKLKRAQADGTIKTMTYVDPETFQTYVDNYNVSGSEADRNIALSHFTLERTTIANNSGTARPIEAGETINIPAGLGAVHTYMGWQMITSTTSTQYKLREQAGMNFDEEGFGRINGRYVIACTTTYGQVGDYVDFYQADGTIIPCIIGDIKNQNDAGCNEWGHLDGTCIIEFVVDKTTWYDPMHENPGTPNCHPEWNQYLTKAVNGGSYFDNPDFGAEGITPNGNSSTGSTASSESMDGMVFIGDSFTVGLEQTSALSEASFYAQTGAAPQYWIDHFNELPNNSDDVTGVCVLLGVNNPDQISQMKDLITKLADKYSNKNIYIQRVFPVGTNYTAMDRNTLNSKIDNFNNEIRSYCNTVNNIQFIDTTTGYLNGDGSANDSLYQNDGLHLKSYQNLANNIVNAIGSASNASGELYWPTDGTTITSEFGLRTSPTAGASSNHKGIDIGVPTGTNIYAAESGSVTMAGWSDSGGYMVTIDHGNGYVTKYMHNSELLVSAGDTVQKGQVIAKAGSTGISTGSHLHFQVEYNGQPVDPLSFKYNNGMGNGTGGFGNSSGGTSDATTTTYYAKVATWNEVTDRVESDDPDVENYSTTTYNMTTTKINYQELVSAYTMPFDYLWDLLVVSKDQDFVLDLADLVLDSEIEITVHDNLSINTNVNVYTYTEKMKTETTASVSVIYGSASETVNTYTSSGGPWTDEESQNYTTTHTVITKTNTLDIDLTKANVWIVNYTKEFKYTVPENVVTNTENDLEDSPYPSSPDEVRAGTDTYGHASALLASEIARWTETYEYVDGAVTSVQEKIYYATVNKHESITNTLERNTYIAPPKGNVEEKTDKNSEEPNFVTLLLKEGNRRAKHHLLENSTLLCDLLLRNDSTSDTFVDLTKYLFYKATGNPNYWDPEKPFDFSIFDPDNFASNNNGSSGIEGVPGQIYDFLLQKGVPPVGAAAILGNIQGESSFNSSVVNSSGYSGLCQWGGGRLSNLKSLADSKGKDWTDVEVQLEFLWQELCDSYSSVKDVIMAATQESDMEYATWYFGRYYEIFFTGTWPSSKDQTAVRYQYAQEWYEKYKQSASSITGEGTVYYQTDYNEPYGNGTIADTGCGPTCFAMVASDYLGRQVTPVDAIAWCGNAYYVSGQGTSWSYFAAAASHFNLPCTVVDLGNNINAAVDQLRNGNLVISSQGPGIFTSGGHFILLSSVDASGGIRVRDPNKNNAINKGYADRVFTAAEINASGRNYWAFVRN